MTDTATVADDVVTDDIETTQPAERRQPWDRVNLLVDEDGAPLELDSTDDVLEATGLDFTVSKRKIKFERQDGTWQESQHRVMIVRDDNETDFDVVSADYGTFQYTEAFSFLNHIPGRQFIAAGPLKGFKQAFMVVRLPDLEGFDVAGSDEHDLNVVIRTSHDRSRAVEVFVMPVRIRCVNQLPLRSSDRDVLNRWAVNHVGNVGEKMHDAELLVERTRAYVEDFKITAERLVHTDLTTDQASTVLRRVLRDAPRRDETIETIISLWQNADTVGFRGTGWGLTNAISDYHEHGRRGGTAQSRLLGALEGSTRSILDRTVPFILSRYGAKI